jgi:mRNA-degrading endonuclease toxin of MazEF toxin-antitoxin module
MLYQIRTIDKRRFSIKLGELSESDYVKTKEKLKVLLEFF